MTTAESWFRDEDFTLRDDGSIVQWNSWGHYWPYTTAGLTNVVARATGSVLGLALLADGTVVQLYQSSGEVTDVPIGLGSVVAVAIGGQGWHTLPLRADGTVVAWGENGSGETNVPAGLTNVVAITAGQNHSLVLRADGTVVAWSAYQDGSNQVPMTVPSGLTNVVAVAAGHRHSLALRADGTVVAWGDNSAGQTNIPTGLSNVVAIAGGGAQSLGLRADGTVVAWGSYWYGWDGLTWLPATVLPGLTNVIAVAAGFYAGLILLGEGPPVVNASLSHPTMTASGFGVTVPTQSGRVYALEYKSSLADATWVRLPLVAGTGHELTLTDPTATGTQRSYRAQWW